MSDQSSGQESGIINPTEITETDYDSLSGINEFLDNVTRGNSYIIPLERLLRLNGNMKRGKYVNRKINEALERRGLVSEPPVERADYYGSVIIHDPRDRVTSGSVGLPISAFAADQAELVVAKPNDQIGKIKTLMIVNDYSQIPVIDGKNLLGSVTWKSLANNQKLTDCDEARKAISTGGHVADSSDDLFDLVPLIIDDEFIYYRDKKNFIVGVVTASDLAHTFQSSTGPFLRIGEIENRLRMLIDKLPLPQLKAKADPAITRKDGINSARDLTFGEYIRALEDKAIWAQLEIPFDRIICIETLNAVKDVRNDIMHFKNDGSLDEEGSIDKCLNWLRAIG